MTDDAWVWGAGTATGVGSLPGTDIREAVKVVLGELPDLPHLPELPNRGPGADLIGRTAGLLIELPVELYAGRWRVAAHPGRDLLRTHDLRERDLDALTELGEGLTGPLKVQAAGPWTMAASVELPIGGRLLRDHGAARDVCESLTEGLAVHVAEVSRRLPGAQVVLQLDEPWLPAVLAGTVPTESGWQTLRAVPEAAVRDSLRSLVDTVGVPVVVHSCAADVPVRLLREAGVRGVGLDLSLLTDLDPLGEALDAGMGLLAGAAPSVAGRAPTSAQVADKVRALWHRLGFPAAQAAHQVVVTPTCGLAGASMTYARDVLRACRDAGRRLAEA
ncbi:methionine synthase [Luedemannella helvata]|uniref:Methionine synthase n=1 Tax=Luedemannella helvata TaxID=349315 RepID=A0ABP4WDZ3_9ACTN